MKTASILTLALTLTFATACRQEVTSTTASDGARVSTTTTAQTTVALSPEQLGELGALIKKNPDRADQLLTQHGLTRESFEAAIRSITEKPDEARRYAAAYKRAS